MEQDSFDILLLCFILAYRACINELALYLTFNGNTILDTSGSFCADYRHSSVSYGLYGFATRYKLGGWWKNTIVYRLYFIYRIARRLVPWHCVSAYYILIWKTVHSLVHSSTVEFIAIISNLHNGEMLSSVAA